MAYVPFVSEKSNEKQIIDLAKTPSITPCFSSNSLSFIDDNDAEILLTYNSKQEFEDEFKLISGLCRKACDAYLYPNGKPARDNTRYFDQSRG